MLTCSGRPHFVRVCHVRDMSGHTVHDQRCDQGQWCLGEGVWALYVRSTGIRHLCSSLMHLMLFGLSQHGIQTSRIRWAVVQCGAASCDVRGLPVTVPYSDMCCCNKCELLRMCASGVQPAAQLTVKLLQQDVRHILLLLLSWL
jgi:hypothetical protein